MTVLDQALAKLDELDESLLLPAQRKAFEILRAELVSRGEQIERLTREAETVPWRSSYFAMRNERDEWREKHRGSETDWRREVLKREAENARQKERVRYLLTTDPADWQMEVLAGSEADRG